MSDIIIEGRGVLNLHIKERKTEINAMKFHFSFINYTRTWSSIKQSNKIQEATLNPKIGQELTLSTNLYIVEFFTRYCNLWRVISSLHDEGVWADNKDFDEVLISKCMLQDHMPDNVLDALEKVNFNQKQKYEIVLKMFRVS